jgi:hypothetical protein
MTAFGKFLVLLNAFGAVAVLAWAVSAYATRIDPAEAVDTSGEKLTDKVKRLDRAAVAAQSGYAPELARVTDAEARLFDLRAKIDARLKQAEGGVFYDIYASPGQSQPNPLDPHAFDRVDRLVWENDPKRVIKGLDGTPLKGVKDMTDALSSQQKAAKDSVDAIKASVATLADLNAQIDALDARYKWLTAVNLKHAAEIPVLADLRVNWENRSGSLQRRRNQLITRLEDLKGSKVGTAPPTVTPPSSFTLTPNK